ADVLVFLAVSCIPSRRLLQIFAEAATRAQTTTPTLWHSPVRGLTAAPSVCYPVTGGMDALLADPEGLTRPTLVPGRWRDSFAMTARDWRLVLPLVKASHPFDGAPSDIESVLAARSGQLRQVAGAVAYRQPAPAQELSLTATA
uniref:hypothetical protein n=1 Tax=Ornithinimicrobium cerasi TaxID=2248773 RepID=UPI00192A3B68